MNRSSPPRVLRLLWLAAFVAFVADWLYPISTQISRAGGVVLLGVVWFGLIGLVWRHRIIRFTLLGISVLVGVFLALPARGHPPVDALRGDYAAGLRRYRGVTYYWGGESPMGIDCSGLIRRGLIDSLFLRGVRTLDSELVRQAFSIWWHDTTASVLGQHPSGLTVFLCDTPSVNQLDHSRISPGDLAVTRDGIHIMAYLGDNSWIEADPEQGRVITASVPVKDNQWFRTPMTIVRWDVLRQ